MPLLQDLTVLSIFPSLQLNSHKEDGRVVLTTGGPEVRTTCDVFHLTFRKVNKTRRILTDLTPKLMACHEKFRAGNVRLDLGPLSGREMHLYMDRVTTEISGD
jgi:hypothetical protein